MKNRIKSICCLLLLCSGLSSPIFAASFVWNGSGTYWDTPGAWSGGSGAPGSNDDVTINLTNATVLFNSSTPSSITVKSLNMTNGAKIDMGSNAITFTVSGTATITGAASIVGPSNSSFNVNGGASHLTFTSASLDIPTILQNSSSSNITISSFLFSKTLTATAGGQLLVNGSTFSKGATLTAASVSNIQASTFGESLSSYTTTITDQGASGVRIWLGGNHFYGQIILQNTGTGTVRCGGASGDEFIGTLTVNSSANNNFSIAHSATSTLLGNLICNNTSSGVIYFAQSLGSSFVVEGNITLKSNSTGTISIGNVGGVDHKNGTWTTTDFTSGTLYINNYSQSAQPIQPNISLGTTSRIFLNGGTYPLGATLSAYEIYFASTATFEEPVTATGSNKLSISSCVFKKGGTISALNIIDIRLSTFGKDDSQINSYTTNLLNTGGTTAVQWYGDNKFFGTVNIINSGSEIRSGNMIGDAFKGNVNVTNNTSYNLGFSFNGQSTILGNLTITNNSTGTMSFANQTNSKLTLTGNITLVGAATSVITLGNLGYIDQYAGYVTAPGFSGTLNMRNFSQINPVSPDPSATNPPKPIEIPQSKKLILNICKFPLGGVFKSYEINNVQACSTGVSGMSPNEQTTWFEDYGMHDVGTNAANRMWQGGNKMYGKTVIKSTGTSGIHFSYNGNDEVNGNLELRNEGTSNNKTVFGNTGTTTVLNGKLTLVNNSIGQLVVSNVTGSVVTINGDIEVSGTSPNSIFIGNSGSVVQNGSIFVNTQNGFNAGTLVIRRLTQTTAVDQTWNFSTGTAALTIENSKFNIINSEIGTKNLTISANGAVTLSPISVYSPNVFITSKIINLNGGDFQGTATFERLTGATGNYTSYGSCTFRNNFTYTMAGSSTQNWGGATDVTTFYGNATFNLSADAGPFYIASQGNFKFLNNLTISSAKSTNAALGQNDFGRVSGTNEYVSFEGPLEQDFIISGLAGVGFTKLAVNKNGGKLKISKGISIRDNLNLATGNIIVMQDPNSELSLSATAVVANTTSSFVDGTVSKNVGSASGATAFTFPIGGFRNGVPVYAPLTLNVATSSSTVGVAARYMSTMSSIPLNCNSSNPLKDVSNCEYWNFWRKASGGPSFTITLPWNYNSGNGSCTWQSSTVMTVGLGNPSTNTWTDIGTATNPVNPSNNSVGSVISNAYTSTVLQHLTYGFRSKLTLNTANVFPTTYSLSGTMEDIGSLTFASGTEEELSIHPKLNSDVTIQIQEGPANKALQMKATIGPSATVSALKVADEIGSSTFKPLSQSYYRYDNTICVLTFQPKKQEYPVLFTTNLNGVSLPAGSNNDFLFTVTAASGLSNFSIAIYDKQGNDLPSPAMAVNGNQFSWSFKDFASGPYQYVISCQDAGSTPRVFEGQLIK